MKPNISNHSFIAILIVLNLVLAFYATPVANYGDASSYISFSKTLLGEKNNENFAHRSPLYSIILAVFMLIFKAPVLYKMMIAFQYMLIAGNSWLLYLLFRRLFKRKELAMMVALLFNLSFSTIYFANVIITETLTVFLLTLSVSLLLRMVDRGGSFRIFTLGAAIGLLSLARFNAIPLIVPFFILFGYILFRQETSIKKWIYSMAVFVFSIAVILNLWSLYNYQHNGFYGLFPGARVGIPRSPRNITLASLRPDNIVSEANKPVLKIFLKAREEYLAINEAAIKGSLAFLDKLGVLSGLYSGYRIYGLAYPVLRSYYNLPDSASEAELVSRLTGFFNEIAAQNKRYLWKFRFYSLLSGFRASTGGVLPNEYGNINLNFLPSVVIVLYKFIFFAVSVFVFIAFFFFLVSTVKKKFKPDITLLTMFFIVFSFWGINFIFFTVGDANRFKFPAEPFIIGLFVYYIYEIARKLKSSKPTDPLAI